MTPLYYTEAWLTSHSGTKLYTRTYPAAETKAVLVFVHGFCEHVGRYEHAHPKWAERGITVFTFDGRGFGRTALDKENKSKDSSYGKTSWKDQLRDIEWAILHVTTEFAAPVFLMGHSMGGGEVLAFATRQKPPPSPETVKLLNGVIGSSPLIHLTNPASTFQRWAGRIAKPFLPYLPLPAPVEPDDLSHDPEKNKVLEDPLIKQSGTVSGLTDMLDGGERLLAEDYQYWPKTLPIIIFHGTADQVTSPIASEEFIEKITADDKEIIFYKDGFHELVNEPDGVWEKFTNECISWVEKHIPTTVSVSKL
jgi:acylglycerol lipase